MTSINSPLPQRKPVGFAQTTGSNSKIAGPSRLLKELVANEVTRLWADNDQREYSRIVARRIGCKEADIDRIVVGLYLEHERIAHTYEQIVKNAPGMASEAAASVWEAA